MDIFSLVTLVGGLAFFLYGMNVMSDGLEKLAGGKLEQILKKMTSNPLKAMLLGIGITAVIQSSSAVTVMLVGLVNSGIMQISQTVGVIMGANIGTTVTAWLLSMIGIEGDNIFIKLLKPENFSLIFAVVGIILIMLSKKQKRKDIGAIMIGFAVLMYGMKLMSGAVEPLKEMPQFVSLFTAFKNPIFGIAAGTILTGIIQSSSASVGILQALSLTGSISYSAAIPIIMGQNIGTCVTAIISSLGVSKNAKKVSVVHMSFNLIGTAIFTVLYYAVNTIFKIEFFETSIDPIGIAVIHTIFNVGTTVMLLPFSRLIVKIADRLVKTKDVQESDVLIDEILLSTPSIAITECHYYAISMASIAKDAVLSALSLIDTYNEEVCEKVLSLETELDRYEDKLGSFLVKIANKSVSEHNSKLKFQTLHTIGDFERLGDHAANLVKVVNEIKDKKISFSEEATKEIKVLVNAVSEIIELTENAYSSSDISIAYTIEPLEQVIDWLVAKIKKHHIERLQSGNCTIELGFILSELLNNLERISDHCSNIAVTIIQLDRGIDFDSHEYLHELKSEDNAIFSENFSEYKQKYKI